MDRRISLNQLINHKLLYVPPYEDSLTVKELREGHRFKRGGGVYVFHNEVRAFYVGITANLQKRTAHYVGNSRKVNKFLRAWLDSDDTIKCSVFYEPDVAYREILESYLIKTEQPICNVNKIWR